MLEIEGSVNPLVTPPTIIHWSNHNDPTQFCLDVQIFNRTVMFILTEYTALNKQVEILMVYRSLTGTTNDVLMKQKMFTFATNEAVGLNFNVVPNSNEFYLFGYASEFENVGTTTVSYSNFAGFIMTNSSSSNNCFTKTPLAAPTSLARETVLDFAAVATLPPGGLATPTGSFGYSTNPPAASGDFITVLGSALAQNTFCNVVGTV